MTFTVVIPARYASTRLPGKPLAPIAGRPMILHVWDRAMAAGAARVLIATDDARIAAACREAGAEVAMTSAAHASGTDRINEAVSGLGLGPEEVVVNVQGDEPLMPAENIRQVAELAARPGTDMATLHVPITSLEEFLNPAVVKVVADDHDRALYFSRAPIPWPRDVDVDETGRPGAFDGALRHLGIYAYKVAALQRFAAHPAAPLENIERLEQLRALAIGMTIRVQAAASLPPPGVDTPADLEAVRALIEEGQA
ncbi:MAG TPA: 3-deoxy-manno-octulosonate cytidylyltransferase [Gammaproteobacteria bacterium]|nr:3-deoxy-manno-octulosonate cytidylyltransferase [Gammaproteobacteria bacterium]